jgi:hypothetical protein
MNGEGDQGDGVLSLIKILGAVRLVEGESGGGLPLRAGTGMIGGRSLEEESPS